LIFEGLSSGKVLYACDRGYGHEYKPTHRHEHGNADGQDHAFEYAYEQTVAQWAKPKKHEFALGLKPGGFSTLL
jgi:hypothetical protein